MLILLASSPRFCFPSLHIPPTARSQAATIRRFFEHVREAKPTVIATYNGDSFDFPFLLARASAHGIDMYKETGFKIDAENEFKSRSCVHMDCFR